MRSLLQERKKRKLKAKEEALQEDAEQEGRDLAAKLERDGKAALEGEESAAEEFLDSSVADFVGEPVEAEADAEEKEEDKKVEAVEEMEKAVLSALPDAFEMTAPLEEEDYVPLLLRSPLYNKLDNIRNQLERLAKESGPNAQQDEKEKAWNECTKFHVCKGRDLLPRHKVGLRLGQEVLDAVCDRLRLKKLRLKLARSIPANREWKGNAYRNSVHLSRDRSKVYVRRERLDSIGEFLVILAHFAAHLKADDMKDDESPAFGGHFTAALSVIHARLFTLMLHNADSLYPSLRGDDEEAKVAAQEAKVPMCPLPSTRHEGPLLNPAEIRFRQRGCRRFHDGSQALWGRMPLGQDTRVLAHEAGSSDGAAAVLGNGAANTAVWQLPVSVQEGLTGEAAFRTFAAAASDSPRGEVLDPEDAEHAELLRMLKQRMKD